jgi:hypothetical protein
MIERKNIASLVLSNNHSLAVFINMHKNLYNFLMNKQCKSTYFPKFLYFQCKNEY